MPYFCYAWLLFCLYDVKAKDVERQMPEESCWLYFSPFQRSPVCVPGTGKAQAPLLRAACSSRPPTSSGRPPASLLQPSPFMKEPADCGTTATGAKRGLRSREEDHGEREGCFGGAAPGWVLLPAHAEVINKCSRQALHKQLLCFPRSPVAPQEALEARLEKCWAHAARSELRKAVI